MKSTATTKKKTKKHASKGKSKAKSKGKGKHKNKVDGLGETLPAVRTLPKRRMPVQPQHPKNHLLMTTLAIGATGVLGYLGWDYIQKKKTTVHNDNSNFPVTITDNKVNTNVPTSDPTDTPKAHTSKNGFPLKRGSKGETVRKLQQALLDKYGSSILPKYGADGAFGSEVVKALKKLGLPASIDKSTYNVLIQGESNEVNGNQSDIANQLISALSSGDYDSTLHLLKQIENKEGYRQVSTAFKENYRVNGVHQTLVNGVLNTFSDETQKQAIRYEFLRMGLQYDGNKWSLSGVDGVPIITICPTTVWTSDHNTVTVPANMVLGNEIGQKSGFTRFEKNNQVFFVQSSAVKEI